MDSATSQGHERNARAVLTRWRDRVKGGKFTVFRCENGAVQSEQVIGADALMGRLASIDKGIYPYGLETGPAVIGTMWTATALALGVDCGAGESVSGTYKNTNPNMQLDDFIGKGAWKHDTDKAGNVLDVTPYWEEEPSLLISRIKRHVDNMVQKGFEHGGRGMRVGVVSVIGG